MKVVHVSVSRQFSSGQLKQLKSEYNASKLLEGEWTTIGFQTENSQEPFIRRIPFGFRSLFFRKFWGWLVALKMSRSYDLVIMRHMTFDPFSIIFAPLIRNRGSIHHAKEAEELKLIRSGWKGRIAALLEDYCGKFSVCNAKVVFGVTREIAEYEVENRCPSKLIGVYPNGVEASSLLILDDRRKRNEINIAFICGKFSSWHGLDKLFQAIENAGAEERSVKLTIHLIGELFEEQKSSINSSEPLSRHFVCHGVLNSKEYYPILEVCDYGVSSLALERKSLKEASTLKVREMLALGLPVYSGHFDQALPQTAPWARVSEAVTFGDLVEFGRLVKDIPRALVREESIENIEKLEIMKRTLEMLKSSRVL